MKRIFSRIQLEKLRRSTLWLDRTIDQNAGWLIVLAIVFFGLANLSFQRDNRIIIENTHNAAEAAKQAAEDTKNILSGQVQSVTDLKADNEQQTRILCRLILRGDLDLEPSEEEDIERICQEEIDRQSANPDSSQPAANSTPASNGNNGGRTISPTPDSPNQSNSPEEPEQPEDPPEQIPIISDLLELLGIE